MANAAGQGGSGTIKARCISCRSEIPITDSYAHGDFIPCGACRTSHRVMRGEVTRLVIADVASVKEAVRANTALVRNLELELKDARAHFGLGFNGLGMGVLYAVARVGLDERAPDMELLWESLGVGVGVGILLELANWLFLAKRKAISRLSTELQEATAEGRQLQQRLRDASKV